MDWFPALTTTGLFAAALWLARHLIATRLSKTVQHGFDAKLESIRSDLRSKEQQINSLQSGALSGFASRQAAVDKRRLEAIDQLWGAVIDLGFAKAASSWMSVIKFEEASKETAANPNFRKIFEGFPDSKDKLGPIGTQAAKARPHVSPIAWALFSAYQSIVGLAVSQLFALKSGIDATNLFNEKGVNKLIATALPHQAEYVEKYGSSAHHHLLDELEGALLKECERMMRGLEADKAAVTQAAAIMEEVGRVNEKVAKSPSLATPT